MLEGTKKTVVEIEVYDLDKEITEFLKSKGYQEKNFVKYGYESVAENEWCNYQHHTFTVEPEPHSLGEGDLSTGEILDWMCAEGQIEAGKYLVSVFW